MVQRPSSGGSVNEPPEYCCPISGEIMVSVHALIGDRRTFLCYLPSALQVAQDDIISC